MGNLNSPQPKAGKTEIVSFILLVLLSTIVFFVWQQGNNTGDKQENSKVITPGESKINPGNGTDFNSETAPVIKAPDAASVPVPEKREVKKPAEADFKKVKPFASIAPPLPAFEISLTETVVRSETGHSITTTRNSQIIIPPDAFVDARGNVVEGDVKVSYREFHDFHDIFLSGIPMQFEDGTLESAGMIEINAAQNGEPVYVNPENKIQVMLASASKDTDYNLYYLDQKEMKWEVKGKDEVVLASQAPMPQAEILNPGQTYVDSIERKFYYEGPKAHVTLICRSDMRARKKFWFSRKNMSYVFDFSFRRTEKMPRELKALAGITWRYYGKDAQDVFKRLFELTKIPKRTMNLEGSSGYIRVTEDLDAGAWNYQMHFKLPGETLSIPVVPVFRSERSSTLFLRKWKKYSEAYALARNDEQIRFKQFQADTAAYFANNKRYEPLPGNISAESAALRSFQINNFGIWNCDRPIPSMPNTVVARFKDQNGNPLEIKHGYIVVKNVNAVYSIYDFSKFPFNPKTEFLFWAVLPDNKLALIYPEEFANHQNDKRRCSFTVKIDDTALSNISTLKSVLSLN